MDDLELQSSPTELKLTWGNSSITTDYGIQYCIRVYQIMGDVSMLVSSDCTVNRTSYVFSTNESEPNPNDLFRFIVTPRYNAEGAKEGTSMNISGYFIAGKIHPGTIDVNYILLYRSSSTAPRIDECPCYNSSRSCGKLKYYPS